MCPFLALAYAFIHRTITVLSHLAVVLCYILLAGTLYGTLILPVADALPEFIAYFFEVAVGLTCGLIALMADAISLDTFFKFVIVFAVGKAIAYIIRGRELNFWGIRLRYV